MPNTINQVDYNLPQTLDVNQFNLNYSSLIEASAGTGKTYTISYLVLRLLLGQKIKDGISCINKGEPLNIENLLIVTFTNAAASDLQARILERIHATRVIFEKIALGIDLNTLTDLQKDENLKKLICEYLDLEFGTLQAKNDSYQTLAKLYARLLIKAERSIDNAPISTIHSFCNRALNQVYSFEAGRAFNVKLVQDYQDITKRAIYDVWRECFYTTGNYDVLLLEKLINSRDPEPLKNYIKELLSVRLLNDKQGYFGFCVHGFKAQKQSPFEELEFICNDYQKKYQELFNDEQLKQHASTIHQYAKTYEFTSNTDDLGSEFYIQEKSKIPKIRKAIYPLFIFLHENSGLTSENFSKALIELILQDSELIQELLKSSQNQNDQVLFVSRAKKGFVHLDSILAFEDAVMSIFLKLYDFYSQNALVKHNLLVLMAIMAIRRTDEILEQNNEISNDEVLRQLAIALTQHHERSDNLANLLRNQYKVAMIDEFQDTDPIQFEIFNKIYLEDYKVENGLKQTSTKCVCYLIGDPKQSIYAFRGSDINSYQKAKNKIIAISQGLKAPKSCIYTLNTNFRSSQNIIEGVNAIFSENSAGYLDKPFDYESLQGNEFYSSNISFTKVNVPCIQNKLAGSVRFYFEDEYESNYQNPYSNYYNQISLDPEVKVEDRREAIARALAQDVVKVLQQGILDSSSDKSKARKVRPSDIAILVSTGSENNCIQEALKEVNLQSVYFSDQSSVLSGGDEEASVEATNLVFFMEAMCNPTSDVLVSRLLMSTLLKDDSIEAVINKDSSDEFDKEIKLLNLCYQKWERFGFISAFSYYMVEHKGIKHHLSNLGGERALSNYYQIAELIQGVNSKVIGPHAQLVWFKNILANGLISQNFSQDETIKHLESEQELIKIYTIHKSKGLQFPIVFLPYLYGTKSTSKKDEKSCKFYDRASKHMCRSFSQNETLCYSKTDGTKVYTSAYELNKQESNQEAVRLLYVAITRAQAANFYYLNDQIVKGKKAFNQIIDPLNLSEGQEVKLKAIFDDNGLFKNLHEPNLDNKQISEPNFLEESKKIVENLLTDKVEHTQLQVNTLEKNVIDKSFMTASYSSITKGAHNQMFDNKTEDTQFDSKEEAPKKASMCFTFPKGSVAGDFLHKLMENLLSRANFDKDLKDNLEQFILENTQYEYSSLLRQYRMQDELNSNLASWLYDIVQAKLPIEDPKGYLNLAKLDAQDCACELEFFLPCTNFDMKKLNEICADFYQETYTKLQAKYPEIVIENPNLPDLKGMDFNGFMKGSLDLVANFNTKIGSQFFMIDYKSNFLGNDYDSYHEIDIFKSMFQSRYDVQILFYSIALTRYLKTILKDYSYQKDFGGVMYLYLRGLKADPINQSKGVFFVKPSENIIARLENLFSGQE